MKYYLESTDRVLESVKSSPGGLSAQEAKARLEANGRNKLKEGEHATMLQRFLQQLKEPMLIILMVAAMSSGGSMASGLLLGQMAGAGMAVGGMVLALLVSLVLSVPLMMGVWFAPALVLFNGMEAVDALKASFAANLKNLVPMLVYGIFVLVLAFFAALPAGLGFLVLAPVLAGSIYAQYRDLFVAH